VEIRGLENIVSKLAGKPEAGSARPSRDAADASKGRKACREFESILLYRMLSTMRKAFQDEEGEDAGFGGDIFKSMMDEQLSLALAKSGGIGLARMLERALGIESDAAPPRPGKEVQISPARVQERYVPVSRTAGKQAVSAAEPRQDAVPSRDTRVDEAVRSQVAQVEKAVRSRVTQVENEVRGGILNMYDSTIKAAAQVFDVSADLIRAVIIQESGGDPRAVSHKGAKGLMQLTDPTARDLGVTDPFDPVQNILGGTRFLARMLETCKGNLELALASYNAGPGAVKKYGGVPPYKETQNYVKSVMGMLETLRTQDVR